MVNGGSPLHGDGIDATEREDEMKRGQSYEYAAKTVEDAVDEGLRQLGVSREEVNIEVLDEGSRGILGIGASDAQVRLTRNPATAKRQPQESVASATEAIAGVAAETEEPAETVSRAADDVPFSEVDDSAAPDQEEEGQAESEAQLDDNDVDLEDLAYDLLGQLLDNLEIEAEIELSWLDDSEDSDRALHLNVVGDDLGDLIGRNGETLASIQYLIRLMVNQELHRWKNIVIDVGGYKQRRAEQLNQMALRLAEQVVASGRPASLEPMPASERRLIHIALRNHEHVYTASTGEDTRRKVQILPK